MSCIASILWMLSDMTGISQIPSVARILDEIPTTVDAAMKRFTLDASIRSYAACPACPRIYKANGLKAVTGTEYPANCSNCKVPGVEDWEECEAALLDARGQPLRPYYYHAFSDFLAQFLSRSEVEHDADSACDRLYSAVADGVPIPSKLSDAFDGSFLRNFQNAEGDGLLVQP
jgi:hypothetical protein